MSGEELKIKTEPIDIEEEEWPKDLNQPNIKKENEIGDETKGHFAPVDLNFVNFPENMSDAAPASKKAELFKIKTEPIDIKDEWPVDSKQINIKKEIEIIDETKGHFDPAKAKKASKAKKAKPMLITLDKPKPTHPPSTVMIVKAVKDLKARKGILSMINSCNFTQFFLQK